VHTAIVIAVGLGVLAACSLIGRFFGGPDAVATAALVFLPLWFVGAAINMYVGVRKAGYSVADEAPVFAVVFAVPAVAALVIWWRSR
jgi:hypothetical protein